MKTVACLAGDGVGPELMAAATRALDRVSHLHSLELDDVHLPFGGEAVTRSGHPLPASTRDGYRDVDAILVASPRRACLRGREGRPPARLAHRARAPRRARGRRRDRAARRVGRRDRGRARVHVRVVASRPRRGRQHRRQLVRVRRARAVALAGHAVRAPRPRRGDHPAEGAPGGARRGRHGVAPVRRARRRVVALRRLEATVAHGWMPDSGPGVFAPGAVGGRRRRRLRRRRSDRHAADRVADARRGPEAPLRLAHARACGRRRRRAHGHAAARDARASPTR